MSNQMTLILAAGDDFGKWIGGVFFFLILGINVIASILKKQQDERRKREQMGHESMPFPPIPPTPQSPERRGIPTPTPTARPMPTPPRKSHTILPRQPQRLPRLPEKRVQRQQPARPINKPAVNRPANVPRVPVIVKEEIEEEVRPLSVLQQTKTPPRQQPPQPAMQRRPLPHADANSLRNWLKPQTLQAQFVLTELFQPPLALREERRS